MRRRLGQFFQGRNIPELLLLVLLCFHLAGCSDNDDLLFVVSIHPFFTPEDTELEPSLPGTWANQDEGLAFSFTQGEGKAYQVVVHEKVNENEIDSRFEVHLLRLGATRFLDFYPESLPEGSVFYNLHFVRCHAVARLDIDRGALQLTFLNARWLGQRLADKTVDIPHEAMEGDLLLTGTTAEVQDLLFLNANDDEAFNDPLLLDWQSTEE